MSPDAFTSANAVQVYGLSVEKRVKTKKGSPLSSSLVLYLTVNPAIFQETSVTRKNQIGVDASIWESIYAVAVNKTN